MSDVEKDVKDMTSEISSEEIEAAEAEKTAGEAADQTETAESDVSGAEDDTRAEQTDEENGSSAEEEKTADAEEKKGFFGKKKKDKRDAQIEELTDRVRRQMAEFDNFRKRTEKEKASMYDMGVRSTVEKILPVVDNFERGLKTAEDLENDPFVEGMQKIYKQLTDTLAEMEVQPIEAVGQPFNPDLHNAVMHIEDDSFGENTVAEEFLKGYTHRGVVVRHSMVKVAN